MSIRGWGPGKEVLGPRGMQSLNARKRKGTPTRASYMQNMRISPGVARSRDGLAAVSSVTGQVTGLFNWIAPDGTNHVFFQEGTAIKVLDQPSTVTTLLSGVGTTRAPSFADLDVWTYFCGYDTAGAGTFQCRVFDGANVDKAFRGPLSLSSASAVDSGTGQCTAGTHYFGFQFTSRSGYSGIPSKTVGSTPISVTLSAGLRSVTITVTFDAPADGGGDAKLYLLMTRSDNPAKWYYVPTDTASGSIGERPVPASTPSTTLTFVASLSDEDMAAGIVDSADEAFNLLAQDGSGNGPFNPSFVVAYGQRMCYGAGTTLYVSDIKDPQAITADQHAVRMPNQRTFGYASPLPGSTDLILFGDRWTAKATDNGDKPGTWPPPVKVSDSLGAKTPNLVCARTGGSYLWVATEQGAYIFNGAYPDKPITYLVSDWWERINWKYAHTIQIADDVTKLKCYIAVPIDQATEPSHTFVIDYTNGLTFESCDIGLDVYNTYALSALGIVKEYATDLSNLWFGPQAGYLSIRHFDSSVVCESTSYWESGLVRGAQDFASKLIRVGQVDVWARGTANPLTMYWFGPEQVTWVAPALLSIQGVPVGLSVSPGIEYMSKNDLAHVENYTVAFEADMGEWFEVSGFRAYARPDMFNR
jgi:hypothetical protein